MTYEREGPLTTRDREAVLSVLTEADAGLAQLQAVLLDAHVSREQSEL